MDKLNFKVENKSYYVKIPNQRDMNEADLVYKTKYSEALRYGALTSAEANRIIEERKIFNEDDGIKVRDLFLKLNALGEKLEKTDKFAAAADIIFKMEEVRNKIMSLNMRKNNILDNTAESYADEHRLQFYAAICSFHEDGRRVFKDVDDYLVHANEDLSRLALTKVIHLIANGGRDFRVEWPEFQWRIKHGLMDEQLTPNQENMDKAVAQAQSEIEETVSDNKAHEAPHKNVTKRKTKKKVATKIASTEK